MPTLRTLMKARLPRAFALLLAVGFLLTAVPAAPAALGQPAAPTAGQPACDRASVTADFAARDRLPQSDLPESRWYEQNWNNGWGPNRATLPAPTVPAGCDPVEWQRARVVAAARKYIGLPYRHHHIPGWNPPASLTGEERAGTGLDCSNFTAWVYDYALGLRFTSDVQDQADGPRAPGRRLAPDEPLQPGDLIFIQPRDRSRIAHAALYLGDDMIIDSYGAFGGVTEHPWTGWHRFHFSHARRLLE